ncbi:MAG TPA: hypothetical protein VK427_20380 [Kofleriaceae bacterium]|nr:hypothetical protein [Kofleriaceae bacterium]
MRAALVVVALGACAAPASPTLENATAPSTRLAPRVVVAGPYGLAAEHLPAITAAGTIVIAVRDSDGDRGLPNLTLVERGRDDAERARHVVLSVAEADAFLPDASGHNPALAARIDRANAWLDARRAAALVVLSQADRTRATGGGVVVTWQASHLRIVDGARVVVDRATPAAWRPPQDCVRTAYLGGVARAHRLAVITIAYESEPGCPPLLEQTHVVTW